MIQNKILKNLFEAIEKETDTTSRFKLLEQLEMFSHSIATLKSNHLITNVPFGDDSEPDLLRGDMASRYTALKVAVQDLLIDIDIPPADLQHIAKGEQSQSGSYPSKKTAQKLIDAGVLEGLD